MEKGPLFVSLWEGSQLKVQNKKTKILVSWNDWILLKIYACFVKSLKPVKLVLMVWLARRPEPLTHNRAMFHIIMRQLIC